MGENLKKNTRLIKATFGTLIDSCKKGKLTIVFTNIRLNTLVKINSCILH